MLHFAARVSIDQLTSLRINFARFFGILPPPFCFDFPAPCEVERDRWLFPPGLRLRGSTAGDSEADSDADSDADPDADSNPDSSRKNCQVSAQFD